MSGKKQKDRFQLPIKIPYKTFPGSGNIPWPVVSVKLKRNNFVIPQPILALVDSGASSSVLHPYIAEALGFELKKLGKPQVGTGVGGTHETWMLPEAIDLNVEGFRFVRTFEVINNPRLLWPCILGQDSIFDVACIDFYRFDRYFELRFRTDLN